MKFAVFVAFCLCVCLTNAGNQPRVESWGNVNGRIFLTENVTVKSSKWRAKEYYLQTPGVSWIILDILTIPWYLFNLKIFHSTFSIQGVPTFTIDGITHMDYKSHPVTVILKKGKLGDRSIMIKIESQRSHGINSTFIIYTNNWTIFGQNCDKFQ